MKLTGPHALLVLGPQGSGKGTQVALLRDKLELPVISMGEVFRAEIDKGTPRGLAIKAILDPGNIVPGDLWEEVLRDYVQGFSAPRGVLLDGVVRSLEQVRAFDRIRGGVGLPEPYVLNIRVPEEESMKRLLARGRHDDTESAIRQRLSWSREQTEPVIAHYRAKGRVIDVDGLASIEAVHERIVRALAAHHLIEGD